MNVPASRILALEPDFERGERLKQLVRERVNAEVIVARSGDAAIAAMSLQVPDVILVSALMPPQDEAQLLSHLKQLNAGPDPPVLMVPPVGDLSKVPTARGGRFLPFARRAASPWPAYDPEAIGTRIKEALQQSRSARSQSIRLQDQTSIVPTSAPVVRLPGKARCDRAHRWAPADLPWLCSVQTPWGLEARILNISKSGMLIESHSKLAPDSSTELCLSGQGTTLVVSARVVRSEVAAVDVRGVKYRAAAAFDGRLDLLPDGPKRLPEGPKRPTPSSATPQALAELLVRVTTDLSRGQEAAVIRATFEQGLRPLVSALEIKICDTPVTPIDGNESIYFTVPDGRGSRTILQAIFKPNHEPTAEEFMLLKAAAAVAAVVVLYERTAFQVM